MSEKITINQGNIQGILNAPYSKSITHRALILAGFSKVGTEIKNMSTGLDVLATKNAMEQMGVIYEKYGSKYIIKNNISKEAEHIDCDSSGTTLRLMTSISAFMNLNCTLSGGKSLNIRPMKDLISTLEFMGAEINSDNYHAPIEIKGLIKPDSYNLIINGDKSSQFISSILILTSLFEDMKTKITIREPIISKPYIDLTIAMLRKVGVSIDTTENNIKLIGKKRFEKNTFEIPIDMSSSAFFIVAGALPGNSIKIREYNRELPQADARIIEIVKKAGAEVIEEDNSINVKYDQLIGFEADLSNCPDLFPVLCILGVFCKGKTKLYNAPHLKYKESNRIKSMVDNLKLIDVDIEEKNDGVIIHGGFNEKKSVEFESYEDHRIAMAMSILGTQMKSEIILNNWESVKDSFPTFFDELNRLIQ